VSAWSVWQGSLSSRAAPLRGVAVVCPRAGLLGALVLVPNQHLQQAQTLGQNLRSRMTITGSAPKSRQHGYQDVGLQQRQLGSLSVAARFFFFNRQDRQLLRAVERLSGPLRVLLTQ